MFMFMFIITFTQIFFICVCGAQWFLHINYGEGGELKAVMYKEDHGGSMLVAISASNQVLVKT